MTCSKVRTSLSAMNDYRLREPERAAVVQHLADCADCQRYDQELKFVSLTLREVAPKDPPVDLTYRLRVIASHERARMIAGSNWWSSIRFRLNQILRPLAVPAVGGIFASLLAFAILVPNFTVHANTTNDVQVGLYTPVSIVNPSPFAFNQDVMIEVTVDQNGTVSDYSIAGGKLSKDEMRDVGNFLLFTSFKAATAFGQPVAGKTLLNIALGPQSGTRINVGS
jgi:anti-sigma factor RsiW